MVQIKEVIEEKLNTLELEEAGKLIDLYQQQAPADMDVLIYKSIYHLYMGEIDEALEYAQIAARRYPTNGDIYYNLACIHEQKGEILEACKNFSKALYIYFYTKNEKSDSLGIKEKIDDMVKKYICHCSDTLTDKQGEEALLKCEEMLKCYFGVGVDIYRNKEKLVIGKKCWVTEKEQRYIGRYDRVCDFFVDETAFFCYHY